MTDVGLIAAGFAAGWTMALFGKAVRFAFGVMDKPDAPPRVDFD